MTAAALQLFVEKGFAATRLDDVAAHMACPGTLYLYFDSKEALFRAVIEEGIAPRFIAAEQQVATFEGSSVELLRYLLSSWWQRSAIRRWPGVSKLIIIGIAEFPRGGGVLPVKVIVQGRALMRAVLERHCTGSFARSMSRRRLTLFLRPC